MSASSYGGIALICCSRVSPVEAGSCAKADIGDLEPVQPPAHARHARLLAQYRRDGSPPRAFSLTAKRPVVTRAAVRPAAMML